MSPTTAVKLRRQEWKQHHSDRSTDPDFVAQYVAPLVPELPQGKKNLSWSAEIVRALKTGRLTVRYNFPGVGTLYGKAYCEADLGPHTYRVYQHLWRNGFSTQSRTQVPEPLGFVAEQNLLVMRQASGTQLSELVRNGPVAEAVRGVRGAARWLAAFQATQVPSLEAEPRCERSAILRLAGRLGKVAAAYPDRAAMLLDLFHRVEVIVPSPTSSPAPVPSHGDFRSAHVFVDGETAVVIDLDKIWLSDPARNVAHFVHKIKENCFKCAGGGGHRVRTSTLEGSLETAELLTREFLREYARHAAYSLTNLGYFRARYCLKAYSKVATAHKIPERARRATAELYLSEFEKCVQSVPLQLSDAGKADGAPLGERVPS